MMGWLVPVAAVSKGWVCGRSLAGIAGSNPSGSMHVVLLWLLCIDRQRSLRRADLLSGGILPSVLCMNVILKPQWGGLGPQGLPSQQRKKKHALYSRANPRHWVPSVGAIVR